MVIVVMGVSGCGKTTVGRAVAAELGWRFADADSVHAPAAIRKMAAGTPLTEADRAPWLALLRTMLDGWLRDGTDAVLACSALTGASRLALGVGRPQVRLVYLKAGPETLAARLAGRKEHFAGPSLLASQLATLEEPADGLRLDAAAPLPELMEAIVASLGGRKAATPGATP